MADSKYTPDAQQQKDNPQESFEKFSGAYNGPISELVVNPVRGEGERILSGVSNCFIILGNDRPAGISSGYGGKGTPGSSCIDIIAGYGGQRPVDVVLGEKVFTPKDFKNDAARIYISQKTDLDDNFGIPISKTKISGILVADEFANGISGVAMKADNIRLIARQNIKLVTSHSEPLSNASATIAGGISLIAGYDQFTAKNQEFMFKNALQPMVRGDKLIKFLEKLLELIDQLDNKTNNFINKQNKFNNELYKHTHQNGAPGENSGEMVANKAQQIIEFQTETVPEIIDNEAKKALMSQYFLASSADYINSMWHKLN